MLRLIQEEKATGMSLVPTMANALLNCPELGKFDTSSMRMITMGGAASSPELIARLEQAFHCRSVFRLRAHRNRSGRHHGPDQVHRRLCRTKPTVSATSRAAGWPHGRLRSSRGRFRNARRAARHANRRRSRHPRRQRDGRLLQRAEATKAAITNGWLHTGDMAVWDEENYIHIVDRKKDIIISGGENISSIEVEKAIFAHPAVLECAVVSAPDPQWGEIPVAIVVLKPDQQLNEEQLMSFSEAAHRQIQNASPGEICGRPAAQDGHGKNAETPAPRRFLAGEIHPRPGIERQVSEGNRTANLRR